MGIWNKVLIVAAWALIILVSPWPLWINGLTTAAIAAVVFYLTYRERKGFKVQFVRGNLLYLMPGHVLLLLGLSLTRQAVIPLWGVWVALIGATIAFDGVAHSQWVFQVQRRWAMALYVTIWAMIFLLLHQLVYLGGKLDSGGLLILSVGLAVFGLAYIALALYRFSKLQPLE